MASSASALKIDEKSILFDRIRSRCLIVSRSLAPQDHPPENILKVIQQKLPHLWGSDHSTSASAFQSPSPTPIQSSPISSIIDHTLLSPPITSEQILTLCHQCVSYQFYSVCLPPSQIRTAYSFFTDSVPVCERKMRRRPKICTVIGFPLGYNTSSIKKEEARISLQDGADELDLVLNVGDLKEGKYEKIAAEINDVVIEAKEEEERRRKRVQGNGNCPERNQGISDSSCSCVNMSLEPILVKVILETALLGRDHRWLPDRHFG